MQLDCPKTCILCPFCIRVQNWTHEWLFIYCITTISHSFHIQQCPIFSFTSDDQWNEASVRDLLFCSINYMPKNDWRPKLPVFIIFRTSFICALGAFRIAILIVYAKKYFYVYCIRMLIGDILLKYTLKLRSVLLWHPKNIFSILFLLFCDRTWENHRFSRWLPSRKKTKPTKWELKMTNTIICLKVRIWDQSPSLP